jgi:glycosyltransferase 2 family protein
MEQHPHLSPQTDEPKPPARWRRVLRIVISVALLAVLLFSVDWSSVPGYVERLTPTVAVLVIVIWAAQLAISAWKWQWALRIHGLHHTYPFLSRVLVIGFFLNNFLPTSIGGDAYRVYRTLPAAPPKSRAISAVILERVVGFAALLSLGFLGALALYSTNALARMYVLLGACGAVAAIALFVFVGPRILRSTKLAPITDNLRSICAARAEWVPLVALSLLFQLTAVFVLHLLFHSLGAPLSLEQAALVAAAAGLATIIPFSINGLGIVEATIAGTAVAVGVSYEAGLVVAVLMRLLLLPLTLAAGLLYAFEPRHQYTNVRSPG